MMKYKFVLNHKNRHSNLFIYKKNKNRNLFGGVHLNGACDCIVMLCSNSYHCCVYRR